VAGETFGFIGAMILVSLYALLIFRLLLLAYNTRDKFGSLIVVGVLSMLMFHIFENIGMTIGIMPVTGIPLPFMSYGGSSMFTNMIAVGLALNVGWRRHKSKYRKENVVLKLVPSNIRKLFVAKGKRARV
jgi:rod shape determining protein RodA